MFDFILPLVSNNHSQTNSIIFPNVFEAFYEIIVNSVHSIESNVKERL